MTIYQKYLSLREEILKYKWIESQKQNKDIGFEAALLQWYKSHRKNYIKSYER